MKPPAATRDKLLFHLKTKGPQTAAGLARRLGVTATAARQHLERLEADGLVEPDGGGTAQSPADRAPGAAQASRAARPGRPARAWRLTPDGHARFPEGYAELALGLLDAAREAFGSGALDSIVAARTKAQLSAYAERMPKGDLAARVAALARLRTEEGYMAEWSRRSDGTLLLVENHCPVCAAAEVCPGLCANELELFRELLDGADVERTEHLLEGERRCVYRIAPRPRNGRKRKARAGGRGRS